MTKRKTILHVFDGNNLANRGYFANRSNLTAPDGTPISAVLGLAKSLNASLREENITHAAFCWDIPTAWTWRNKVIVKHSKKLGVTAYKDGRPKDKRPGLAEQMPIMRQMCKAYGIPSFISNKKDGHEADDIAGSIAHQVKVPTYIRSNDKDFLQLISSSIRVIKPDNTIVATKNCREVFGTDADKVLDYLCLVGDSIDAVPGVMGIGPKTAFEILDMHGSYENILKAFHSGNLRHSRAAAAFKKGYPDPKIIKHLIKIKTDIEVPTRSRDYQIRPNLKAVQRFNKKWGIKHHLLPHLH